MAGVGQDFWLGLMAWRLWTRMAWVEVRRRYRRTVLGPFWTTGSMAIFIGALGILYATLWNQDVQKYLPYLTTGFLSWVFVSTLIMESCATFISAEAHLKQVSVPYTMFVFTTILRNLIVFAHHLVVYVVVVLLFDVPINQNTPLALLGLAAISINGIWIGWVFGALGTRYRDIPQLITSLLQVLLFITPILWPISLSGTTRRVFVDMNPFYHLIEIVRAPMLGDLPNLASWYFIAGMTVVGFGIGILVFARVRGRLIYWI